MVKETTVFKHPKMPTPFAPYSTLKCQHHLRFQTPKTPTPFALPDPPCSCCKSCSWSAKAVVLAANLKCHFDWRLWSPCTTRQCTLRVPLHVSRRPSRCCYLRVPLHVAAPTRKRQWWWRHAWASRRKTAPDRNKFQKNPI